MQTGRTSRRRLVTPDEKPTGLTAAGTPTQEIESMTYETRLASGRRVLALVVLCLAARAMGDVVAQWPFDEGPGSTVAVDLIGGTDGTVQGTAAFVEGGISGNAIQTAIDGDGLVNMGDAFPLSTGDFSIVFWLRTAPGDQTPDYIALSRHRSTIVAGYLLGVNQNGGYGQTDKAWFYPSVLPGGELISNTSVNDGAWHQIAIAYDVGNLVRIYIDGAPADNSRPTHPIAFIDAPLLVGGVDFGGTPRGTFNGFIDELQMYDHALTDAEVQELFDDPTTTVCPGDLNADGQRDLADLGILLASYGVDDGGDIDGDGDTDIGDLGFLLSRWNVDCP
jgi:hypothetical protein